MKVRVFYPNKDNKIEFTKQQLEKLLDEVYEEGRAKGYDQGYTASRPVTITYPYTPYWYTCTDLKSYTTSNSNINITGDTKSTISSINSDITSLKDVFYVTTSAIAIGDENETT